MAKREITKTVLFCTCERCEFEWETERLGTKIPLRCPKCKNPNWNKKRINNKKHKDEN